MNKLDFTIVEIREDQSIYGLAQKSNDRSQAKDIATLAKKYHGTVERKSGEVIPFYVLSKDYDERTSEFKLFIGGLLERRNLIAYTIPRGTYVKVTVKPKMRFLWGLSIGEAKKTFYTRWLLQSEYAPLNMEYEHHTERSKGKNPQIDIFFAVQKTSPA